MTSDNLVERYRCFGRDFYLIFRVYILMNRLNIIVTFLKITVFSDVMPYSLVYIRVYQNFERTFRLFCVIHVEGCNRILRDCDTRVPSYTVSHPKTQNALINDPFVLPLLSCRLILPPVSNGNCGGGARVRSSCHTITATRR
jgi:hypothetical protein